MILDTIVSPSEPSPGIQVVQVPPLISLDLLFNSRPDLLQELYLKELRSVKPAKVAAEEAPKGAEVLKGVQKAKGSGKAKVA